MTESILIDLIKNAIRADEAVTALRPRGLGLAPGAEARTSQRRAALAAQRQAWKDAAVARLSGGERSTLETFSEVGGYADFSGDQGSAFTGLIFSTNLLREIAQEASDDAAAAMVTDRLPAVIKGLEAAADFARHLAGR